MKAELFAVVVPVTSAVIGAISGYFGARFQTREMRKGKLDEIAKSLAEIELKKIQNSGYESEYSSIAHWAVLRKLLDDYEAKEGASSILYIRDAMHEKYSYTCEGKRVPIKKHIPFESAFRTVSITLTITYDGQKCVGEAPADLLVNEMKLSLIQHLSISASLENGWPVGYDLVNKESQVMLKDDLTLIDNGVTNGDELILIKSDQNPKVG